MGAEELIKEMKQLKDLIRQQNEINIQIGTQLENIIQTLEMEQKPVKRNYWQIVAVMELILITSFLCLYAVKL